MHIDKDTEMYSKKGSKHTFIAVIRFYVFFFWIFENGCVGKLFYVCVGKMFFECIHLDEKAVRYIFSVTFWRDAGHC